MLIEARNLTRRFGANDAVRGATFAIPRPGIVGLLGANGAGKSTTMRMLAGAIAPTEGHAIVDGWDVSRNRGEAQLQLGYLPEAANGFADLTVWEFILFAAEARGLTGRRGREAAGAIIERLWLAEAAGRRLGDLSKGWRQRAWLAQALVHEPRILILDEPTDGLDPRQKIDLRALLRRLGERCAILMSTHILEEAEELCDRVLVMNRGRLVADAAISRLIDASGRLGPALLALTREHGGARDGEDDARYGGAAVFDAGSEKETRAESAAG